MVVVLQLCSWGMLRHYERRWGQLVGCLGEQILRLKRYLRTKNINIFIQINGYELLQLT